MAIRVYPTNIPRVWEAIKYAATKADGISKEHIPMYVTKLLHDLLSSKASCFIRLDDNNRLVRLAVTKVSIDEITGDMSLIVSTLYGFRVTSVNEWEEDVESIKRYAAKIKCKKILACTNNKKMFEKLEDLGFKNYYKHFILEV